MMSRTREVHSLKILATTVGAALLVCGLLLAYASSPAWAADITVNSLADDADGADGECTLREAITSANNNTASGTATGECAAGSSGTTTDVINIGTSAVPVTGTVNLTGALPTLSTNIQIVGPGADKFTVRRDTGGDYRIFTVNLGSTVVTISGITISNGKAPSAESAGGGIRKSQGTLTVANTTISGNSADLAGGGIYSIQGDLTVTNSTISGNSATGSGAQGGGIFSATDIRGVTTITNSTISGNTARRYGGGVNNIGPTVIEFSTITNNTAQADPPLGGGVASRGDTSTRTEVLSSIISANQGTDVDFVLGDGTNSFVSNGYNLIGDGNATGAFNQTGDQVGVTDPKLDPLGDNGGPTMTHALLTDSLAIDAGPPSPDCPPPSTDQRGVERPQDGNDDATPRCDIGSFELEDPTPNVKVARGGVCGSGDIQGTINLALSDSDTSADALTLSATSSNQAVVPDANIVLGGGTDASRTLTLTAIESGTSTLTLTVDDGQETTSIPIKVLVGTDAAETLTGSAMADMILAGKGDDTASGRGARDLLCGRSGNDTLLGEEARDTLLGGKNDDGMTGGPGADKFAGGPGTDTATDFNAAEGDRQSGIP
jgi:CSLREA domain-containing protein